MYRISEHHPRRSIKDIIKHVQMRWRWRAHGTDPGNIDVTAEEAAAGIVYGFVGGLRAFGQPPVDAEQRKPGDSSTS